MSPLRIGLQSSVLVRRVQGFWGFHSLLCKICFGVSRGLAGQSLQSTVNPRKLESGYRMIHAGIPYALPYMHEDNDVPTFRLLLYIAIP